MCFHSIGFPCERGATIAVNIGGNIKSFHSIGFPCERGAPAPAPAPAAPEPAPEFPFNWFPLREGRLYVLDDTQRAALFPFNWFPLREGRSCKTRDPPVHPGVSIQLVSPARGEDFVILSAASSAVMFPFNWFPLREGREEGELWYGEPQ